MFSGGLKREYWLNMMVHRNQSFHLLRKSMDWFLYDNGIRLKRVKGNLELALSITLELSEVRIL